MTTAPQGSELLLRWRTAGLLVPLALAACIAGGAIFVALVSVVSVIGVYEFQGMLRAKGVAPLRFVGWLSAGLLPWVVYEGNSELAAFFVMVVLLAVLLAPLFASDVHGAIASAAGCFFGFFYVAWLLAHVLFLRFLASDPRLADEHLAPAAGIFFTLFALAAAVGSDAGGFFAGRSFGRRKLAPRISPGKTVEGACGAIAGGTALGLAVLYVFRALAPDLTGGFSVFAALIAAMLLAAVAIAGDLIESLFKRDASLKDAGHILPGIGGVLDRIDSLLLVFPVMYYCLLGYYWTGS